MPKTQIDPSSRLDTIPVSDKQTDTTTTKYTAVAQRQAVKKLRREKRKSYRRYIGVVAPHIPCRGYDAAD